MASVTPRLEALVRQDFEAGSVEPVLARLSQLDGERVQTAVVLLSTGSWTRFEGAIKLAETDWRDVLISAGLEHEDWPLRLDAVLGSPDHFANPS